MNTMITKLFVSLFVSLFVFAGTPTLSVAKANPTSTVTSTTSCPTCAFVVDARDYNDHVTFLYPGHVHINLSGDGDTDLDLEVYGANGALVARSVGRTDDETIALNVCCSGYVTIRVKNLGRVYNNYRLWIS